MILIECLLLYDNSCPGLHQGNVLRHIEELHELKENAQKQQLYAISGHF